MKSSFDDEFTEMEVTIKKMQRLVIITWCVAVVFGLSFLGFLGWVVWQLLQHFSVI